jgi:putative PIN family toxin of toxin-antitoxin system
VITAVLDTNVLASAILGLPRPTSTPGELLRRWYGGAFTLIVSEHILSELGRTLSDRYFTSRLEPDQVTAAFEDLRVDAVMQPIRISVQGVATQPKDDLILAAALSAGADYLVTRDKPLQALGHYQTVRLLSPRQFLDLLESEAP